MWIEDFWNCIYSLRSVCLQDFVLSTAQKDSGVILLFAPAVSDLGFQLISFQKALKGSETKCSISSTWERWKWTGMAWLYFPASFRHYLGPMQMVLIEHLKGIVGIDFIKYPLGIGCPPLPLQKQQHWLSAQRYLRLWVEKEPSPGSSQSVSSTFGHAKSL